MPSTFDVLAEPTRRAILDLLIQAEQPVGDLVETLDDGRHRLVFERRLNHPVERVWAALTEPDQIEAWLARAELEPRAGGRVRLQWLNTDDAEGNQHEQGVVANGTVAAIDAPRLLELDTDVHGRLRWELSP